MNGQRSRVRGRKECEGEEEVARMVNKSIEAGVLYMIIGPLSQEIMTTTGRQRCPARWISHSWPRRWARMKHKH
jgi:hypothetical protein